VERPLNNGDVFQTDGGDDAVNSLPHDFAFFSALSINICGCQLGFGSPGPINRKLQRKCFDPPKIYIVLDSLEYFRDNNIREAKVSFKKGEKFAR